MNFIPMITQLTNNAKTIRSLAEGVSRDQARWKPDIESWSILEVINHLFDEEREDFRVRLEYILTRPGEIPPEIDPQGWVVSRKYNEGSLSEAISKFSQERHQSLHWLGEIIPFNAEAASELPFGSFQAGDMFAAWVAHDLLHMRQLVELHYQYTVSAMEPWNVSYAGEW